MFLHFSPHAVLREIQSHISGATSHNTTMIKIRRNLEEVEEQTKARINKFNMIHLPNMHNSYREKKTSMIFAIIG